MAQLRPLKAGEDPHQPQNLTTAELDTARASSPRGCGRGVHWQVRGRGARHHRWRWIRPLILGATWVWRLGQAISLG